MIYRVYVGPPHLGGVEKEGLLLCPRTVTAHRGQPRGANRRKRLPGLAPVGAELHVRVAPEHRRLRPVLRVGVPDQQAELRAGLLEGHGNERVGCHDGPRPRARHPHRQLLRLLRQDDGGKDPLPLLLVPTAAAVAAAAAVTATATAARCKACKVVARLLLLEQGECRGLEDSEADKNAAIGGWKGMDVCVRKRFNL